MFLFNLIGPRVLFLFLIGVFNYFFFFFPPRAGPHMNLSYMIGRVQHLAVPRGVPGTENNYSILK